MFQLSNNPTRKIAFPNSFVLRFVKPCLGLFVLMFSLIHSVVGQTVAVKPLYLSSPSQSLDRIDPEASADATTAISSFLSSSGNQVITQVGSPLSFTVNQAVNAGSFSYNSGTTGANRALFVAVSYDNDDNESITSINYAGQNLTLAGNINYNSGGHNPNYYCSLYIYYLINPPTGSNSLSVNFSGNLDNGAVIGAVTYAGVNQSTPVANFFRTTGNNATPSVTATGSAGQLFFGAVSGQTSSSYSVTGGGTSLWTNKIFSGTAGSGQTKAGAASASLSWSGSGTWWAAGAVSINPASAVTNTSFTQSPALCSALTIKSGQPITVNAYVDQGAIGGNMPANPSCNAVLKYGTTTIINLSNPVYASATGLLTWTGTLSSDLTIPAGQSIVLEISSAQAGLSFRILFDSQTYPSSIQLPVTTFIDILSYQVFSAPYPGGTLLSGVPAGTTVYPRAVVSDPFGFNDITGLTIQINPPGSTVSATSVATAGCTRTYEYVWNTPLAAGTYSIPSTALEGLENTVTDQEPLSVDVCSPATGAPIFNLGASSSRCQGAGMVLYAATATNAVNYVYSLDAPSLAAGNTINSATGEVSYTSGWSGTSIITVTATGCGSQTASHTVSTNPSVGTPVFASGLLVERCKAAGTVTYTATASNATGITYSLDAASLLAGNTINATTGQVNFTADWSGTTVITASADGCNGPNSTTFTVEVSAIHALDDDYTGTNAIENGTPGFFNVLANDLCDIDPSSVSILIPPAFGEVQVDQQTGQITYLPTGRFSGNDQFTYQVCDHSSPTPVCSEATVYVQVLPDYTDPCQEAILAKTFYLPFPENSTQLYQALYQASNNSNSYVNLVRSVTSIKCPYPGTIIYFDHWEDGYETSITSPTQSSTQIWGDGRLNNGVAPGYPNDRLPAGASIVLDNTFQYRERNASNIYYDGKDKLYSNSDIAVSKVTGDDNNFSVQNLKSNVYDLSRYGKLFTVGLGEISGIQYFSYAAFMIAASENNTTIHVDLDNDGVVDTTTTLQEGQVWFYQGQPNVVAATTVPKDIRPGAVVTADKPINVELILGDNLNFGTRNVNILPGKFYGHTYYTPVPSVLNDGSAPAVVYFVNNNNTPITVNWRSGVPGSGTVAVPANGWASLNLAISSNAAYKFWSQGGETFTALEIMDADAQSQNFDWAITLMDTSRLTNFTGIAWAPGSLDGSRNDGPIWVTPTANTTIYVKFDGNLTGTSATMSPCNIPYDVAYQVDELKHIRIKDPSDNDQSGLVLYTCDGTPFAAVYGEDASTAVIANPSLDVGTNLTPRCLQVLINAVDNYETTEPNTPITINVTNNDIGFLCTVDPLSVNTTGLLPPSHGTIVINPDGTITYTPDPGYIGPDVFEYRVCSIEYSTKCDVARVYISITDCNAEPTENLITGKVYVEQLADDGVYNVGESFASGIQVDLVFDANCNSVIDADEPVVNSAITDLSGNYRFSTINGYYAADNFDPSASFSGNDGSVNWSNNWTEQGDNNIFNSGDVRILSDATAGGTGNAIRIGGPNNGINRQVSLNGAISATLKFRFRRQAQTDNGAALLVQFNGTTVYTVDDGNGLNTDNFYQQVNVILNSYNPNGVNTLQFMTNGTAVSSNFFWIDDVQLTFFRQPSCWLVKLNTGSSGGAYTASSNNQQAMNFTSIGQCSRNNNLGVLVGLTATDDVASTSTDIPVNIPIINNDIIGIPNPSTVTITSQPANGTVTVNPNGTVTYTPNPGYNGTDVFNYQVCSLQDPAVCDIAQVTVNVSCFSVIHQNVITGIVFNDVDNSGTYNLTDTVRSGVTVNLYNDLNGNGTLDGTESLLNAQTTNNLGSYQFTISPSTETLTYRDNFSSSGTSNQSTGTSIWSANPWYEIGENDGLSGGDVTITSGNGLRITTNTASTAKGAYRSANLATATSATLSFSYAESGMDIEVGDYVDVMVANSPNPASWTLLRRLTGADGNQNGTVSFDITPYISPVTTIRFIGSDQASMGSNDMVYIDNVQISYTQIAPNTYLDQFNTNGSGTGSNGSINWSDAWSETGEANGLNNGSIFVTNNQLRIGGNGLPSQISASRSVNLSSATSAYLSFDYYKNSMDDNNDWVDVQVSAHTGGPWTTITRIEGPANNSGTVHYDIPANMLSANTTIRFIESNQSSMGNSDYVAFDNIQFSYYTPQHYIVQLAQPIPSGFVLSSPAPNPTGLHAISFTGNGQGSCGNNFGLVGADLVISKTANPATVYAGQTLTYTITVTNNGPCNAENVSVTDQLPAGFTATSATPAQGTWSAPSWTIGTLTPGQTVSLVITGMVSLNQCSALTNSATVSSTTTDPDPSNNQDEVTTPVLDQTNPDITACPQSRTVVGCSVADITDPTYTELTTASTYAVFSNATNAGSATDNCGIVSITYSDVSNGTCPTTVTRTWTITDASGNSSTCVQVITLVDSIPPVVQCSPSIPAIVYAQSAAGYTHAGSGWDASITESCSYTMSAALSGATILSGLSTLDGVVFNVGSTQITWTATDACGNSASCSVTVAVQSVINAVDNTGTPVYTGVGGTAYGDVLDNDTLNQVVVNPSDVITTFISSTNPGVTLSGTSVVVDPSTPAGTYTLIYQICEVVNPDNCDQATVTITVLPTFSISGTVFDDANGLTDSQINGTGVNPGGLNAVLVDASGHVVSVAPVATDGTYGFNGQLPGNYIVVITTASPVNGDPAPSATLPSGWVHTGEGTDPAGDGNVNGQTNVFTVSNADVTSVNFGINQIPTANMVTAPAQVNPGGSTQVTVPVLTGSDPEDGVYSGVSGTNTIIIQSVPSNGILYYNGSPVTNGQTITNYNPSLLTLDPSAGAITVTFTYSEVDNAGTPSVPNTVVMPFLTVSITGHVFNDVDGMSDGVVDGAGTNAGGLNAVLLSGNTVMAVAPVDPDGYYAFTSVSGGQYSVLLTTSSPNQGDPAPAASLPVGWVNTGEGTMAAGDGNVNGQTNVFTVAVADVDNVNFGIEQLPTPMTNTAPGQENPEGTNQVIVPPSIFGGTDPSGGIITSIIITGIPSNVTSIVINGTTYTSVNFPPGGVQVPTNASGEPTQVISIDPNDGLVIVNIPYLVVDNADQTSVTTGNAIIPFTTTVPITLLDFNAFKNGQMADLKWTTEQEINSSHFDIERSADGRRFDKIGRTEAAGTSSASLSYLFTDSKPLNGVNYYRLKMIDRDGSYAYSSVRMLKFDKDGKLDVFPNPATSFVNISFPQEWIGKDATIEVYNNTGQRVNRMLLWDLMQSFRLKVDNLPNGTYHLKISLQGREPEVRSIQVVR